jgi:hypothetical protein
MIACAQEGVEVMHERRWFAEHDGLLELSSSGVIIATEQ